MIYFADIFRPSEKVFTNHSSPRVASHFCSHDHAIWTQIFSKRSLGIYPIPQWHRAHCYVFVLWLVSLWANSSAIFVVEKISHWFTIDPILFVPLPRTLVVDARLSLPSTFLC